MELLPPIHEIPHTVQNCAVRALDNLYDAKPGIRIENSRLNWQILAEYSTRF